MKIQTLKQVVQGCGKVTVRLTDKLLDESWGQKGMLADVIQCIDKKDGCRFVFDYQRYLDNDLPLQPRNYYIANGLGTAFEASLMSMNRVQEEIYLEKDGEISCELVDGLLDKYLSSGSKLSFVEWMGARLNVTSSEDLVVSEIKALDGMKIDELHQKADEYC
ncbi:MAG: hypothetical protein M0P12_00185 [Paludibacteraceae bacterium]|nr:hypothetical protein [Paludibacteraceae bacterium]